LKIRFLQSVASSVHGSHQAGDVTDWKDDKEAKQLIAAGMAEAVSKSTKVEKATQNKATETATTD